MGRFSFQTQCRARIKTTLCQLLCPFELLFFHTLFSAVLSNSFWVQIFFGILLHSAYYR
uniref:Uncharacterized protein n=1 Tax=Colobus angolensis palliatus TaxID=336983 RepID=A0A2K5HQ23_COLAP